MLKELSLCHAGRRNDNYADNNGNNNGNGNENGYDKGTGHKECRDIAETVFKLHRIHFFLFRYTKSNHKKTSHRLITDERSNYFISSSAQQQQPAVPQPIITATVIIIMLIMLLKNLFILPVTAGRM